MHLVKNKLLFLFLEFFISKNILAQSISEIENAGNNLENIIHGSLSKDAPHLFRIGFETIDTILKRSDKKYKIVYLFSMNCHSSLELFPRLVDFVNSNSEFELFPIEGHRAIDTAMIKKYLSYYNFFGTMFILDTDKYGNKRNPFSRLDKLTKTICKECDYKKMGFSSFYIFDEENKVVLHNSWTTPGLKKMDALVEWYKMKN